MSFLDKLTKRIEQRASEGAAFAPGKLTPLQFTELEAVAGGTTPTLPPDTFDKVICRIWPPNGDFPEFDQCVRFPPFRQAVPPRPPSPSELF